MMKLLKCKNSVNQLMFILEIFPLILFIMFSLLKKINQFNNYLKLILISKNYFLIKKNLICENQQRKTNCFQIFKN